MHERKINILDKPDLFYNMNVKINFRCQIYLLSALIIFITHQTILAQDTLLNKYGLWIIKDVKILKATVKINSNKKMIDVKKIIPDIDLDLKYAGKNNFMHKKLYNNIHTTYLRTPAAIALQQVQKELNLLGLGLKIFDAYRPYSVTEKMWEPIKDDRYVADPKKGSGHNRGIAVDLTIINLKTKEGLNMGTGFDNFSDTAHQNFSFLPQDILKNRKLLISLMEKNGFKSLETEWWHYSLPNAKDFELLDVSFKSLRNLNN